MLKPKAVEFRVNLWKLYQNLENTNQIPKSGLNFLNNKKLSKSFMLLCGFENFGEYFVRIDILEKLFIKIIEKTSNKQFQINSDMMNLLGCSKEDFYKLMEKMRYKKGKEQDTYIFTGEKKKSKHFSNKIKEIKDNPFNKLLNLNIK